MLAQKKAPPDRSGERIRAKYQLDSRIAVGGMGEVYRATNTLVGREVAIKILLPSLAKSADVRARFLREAQLAHFVRHAHVVEILDIDEDERGYPFIVQELLEGEDLATYLDRAGGALPIDVTLAVLVPVADALGAAHQKGLVHRDLKPENIFLSAVNDELIPKILDFGISKVTKEGVIAAEAEGRLIVGSPTYMSPEQIRAPADVDQRTDVWAVGVILYECLAGRRPFDAVSVADLFVQICRDDPPSIETFVPEIPRALRDLVMGCINRRPDRRPQDGTVLARALHRVSSRLSGALSVPGTVSSWPPTAVGGKRGAGKPVPHGDLAPTAPDLSEYGAFQVPDELRLDYGHLGARGTPESIANAVKQATAERVSVAGGPPSRDARASHPGAALAGGGRRSSPAFDDIDLDIDPRALHTGSRTSLPSGAATAGGTSGPRSPGAHTREAVRPGRAFRPPEVPSLASLAACLLWLVVGLASVVVLAPERLPAWAPPAGPLHAFGLLALVIGLASAAIGVLVRAPGSPAYTLALAGLGGAGLSVAVLFLGLRHTMPNLPGVREHHPLAGLLGLGALSLLAFGLGARGLVAGADAFRVHPRRTGFGALLLGISLALVTGGALLGYGLSRPEYADALRLRLASPLAGDAPPSTDHIPTDEHAPQIALPRDADGGAS